MSFIPDTLRREYEALRTLRIMAASETVSLPIDTLHEQSAALEHLMRVTEENAKQEIEKARAHIVRAGRDLYFLLLAPKLDRLRFLSTCLPTKDLARFRIEYQKIKESVQAAETQPERIPSINDYIVSLAQIDSFLNTFTDLETQVASKTNVQAKKYREILIAILFGLFGAVISLVIEKIIK